MLLLESAPLIHAHLQYQREQWRQFLNCTDTPQLPETRFDKFRHLISPEAFLVGTTINLLGQPVAAFQGISAGVINEFVKNLPSSELRDITLAIFIGSMAAGKVVQYFALKKGFCHDLGASVLKNALPLKSDTLKILLAMGLTTIAGWTSGMASNVADQITIAMAVHDGNPSRFYSLLIAKSLTGFALAGSIDAAIATGTINRTLYKFGQFTNLHLDYLENFLDRQNWHSLKQKLQDTRVSLPVLSQNIS